MKRAAAAVLSTCAAVALGLILVPALAKPANPAPANAPAASPKAQMQAMVDALSAPAPEHKTLEALIGSWDQTLTFSFPGADPIEIRSVVTGEWMLGGRFLTLRSVPAPGEEFRFESLTILGFDARGKVYTAYGVDTMGTYAVSAQGGFDAQRRMMVLRGTNTEPGVGDVPFRFEIDLSKADAFTWSIIFTLPDASDMTVATIHGTRRA